MIQQAYRTIRHDLLLAAILAMVALLLPLVPAAAQQPLANRYTSQRPLLIVGDWDKPPYEFLSDDGRPSGTHIDILTTICRELGIPYKFVLKEWSSALKTFERGEADIILASAKRYRNGPYIISENVVNYDRVCAASYGPAKPHPITADELVAEGVVLKTGSYPSLYFRNLPADKVGNIEYQSPKVALKGLLSGDNKYFVWGEEPLKWKIREYNFEEISVNEVNLPVSEIHIIGRDRELIYSLDDHFSRLKQRGDVQRISDRWLHPERVASSFPSWIGYMLAGFAILVVLLYFLARLARAHVRAGTRKSSEMNNMMFKALHMGDLHVMVYDIRRDLMTNRYGQPILPEQGITLKEFTSRIHPNEVAEFTRKMDSLLSGREQKFVLKKRWKAYGETDHWLYLDGHAMVELDDEGRPAYVVNAIHDVTKDEETERTIYEMECKYRTLSNMSFVAMSFYNKDGWLSNMNDAMKGICGISDDKPDSKRFWTTVSLFDVPMFRNAYHAGNDMLLACSHMNYPEMGLDRYIEYDVRPLFNERGELVNYFVSAFDMTDERARQTALVRLQREEDNLYQRIDTQQQWLAYILRQGERYIIRHDAKRGEVAFYRDAYKPDLVYDVEDFCANRMADEDSALFRRWLDDGLSDGKPCVIHLKPRADESTGIAVYMLTARPVTDAEGLLVGHLGIAVDITPLDDARRQLQYQTLLANDSMKMKSDFMASMTHELRTPLNAVIGFVQVLEMVDSPAEREEYIRIVRNNSDMLQQLISDILTVTSMTDGSSTVELAEVDFSKAFDDFWTSLQQRMQNPDVAFLKDNPYDTFPTKIDIGRVQQVVNNFVSNAVKFTQKGHIKLGYRYEKHQLVIYCEDTGIGIPKDRQAVIFERFLKLDEFAQGTGMGLAVNKSLVENLGGTIGVESDGEGQGATFWAKIPCEKTIMNDEE